LKLSLKNATAESQLSEKRPLKYAFLNIKCKMPQLYPQQELLLLYLTIHAHWYESARNLSIRLIPIKKNPDIPIKFTAHFTLVLGNSAGNRTNEYYQRQRSLFKIVCCTKHCPKNRARNLKRRRVRTTSRFLDLRSLLVLLVFSRFAIITAIPELQIQLSQLGFSSSRLQISQHFRGPDNCSSTPYR